MNNMYTDEKVINIIDEVQDLEIAVESFNKQTINIYSDNLKSFNINISMQDDATLLINLAGLIKKATSINIMVNINGNNNKCLIKSRTIAINDSGNVMVNVKAKENSVNNEILEDLKGINEEGTICLLPILEIDTSEVNASHYATVGGYNENELFYLESKGLSPIIAKNILKKVFIYNIFTKEFVNEINLRKENYE